MPKPFKAPARDDTTLDNRSCAQQLWFPTDTSNMHTVWLYYCGVHFIHRWLEYSRCGEVIDETGILASKTPLKKAFHKCKERPEGIPPAEE